ncbi:MAG TPA: nuclear transport factor 2 family protein [Candidatus Krumholzibacteria bacterium]|nr:nuclear transport factor 2 family protein [Candidatus Krumholzibacteria bacterium]
MPATPSAAAQALMAADRAFAAEVGTATPADRAHVWAAWFTEDGRQLAPGAVVSGAGSIIEAMDGFFRTAGATLQWAPDLADGDGRFGWTSGRYVSTRPGPDGPVVRQGRYLTVWRRDEDRGWKVAVDTGVPDDQG